LGWTVEFDRRAAKELRALDPGARRRVLGFLRERIAGSEDPRSLGKPLKGQAVPLWRYRVGPYRLICSGEDQSLVVLVVRVGHRRQVCR